MPKGFHNNKTIKESDLDKIEGLLNQTKDILFHKRLTCLYMRGRHQSSIDDITKATGLFSGTVRKIWSKYFKDGLKAIYPKPRGGKRYSLLSYEDEVELLSKFTYDAKLGRIVEVSDFHKALCEKTGKKVALSTAYDIVHRHGWRKVTPRPSHPKKDSIAEEYFKIF